MWDSGTGPKSVTREVRRCGQLWVVIRLSQLPSNYCGLSTGARKRYSPIILADTGRGQWEKTLRRSVSKLGHMGDMMAVVSAGWSPEPPDYQLHSCAWSLPRPAASRSPVSTCPMQRGTFGGRELSTHTPRPSQLRHRREPHRIPFKRLEVKVFSICHGRGGFPPHKG